MIYCGYTAGVHNDKSHDIYNKKTTSVMKINKEREKRQANP